jgi:hypothetical protein
MILYNVTVNIDKDVELEWLSWMKTTHIPAVMATGQFVEYNFYRLIGEIDNGGETYSVQYFATSMKQIDVYLNDHAPKLRNEVIEKYANKHVAFRTVLESVD